MGAYDALRPWLMVAFTARYTPPGSWSASGREVVIYSKIAGAELARLMNGVGGDTLAATLIGCHFQTQKSDDAGDDGFPILAVDIGAAQVTVRSSNGSASSVPLGRGSVELDHVATALLDEVRKRLAAPYPDDAKVLQDNGIGVEMGRSDAIIVARVLCDAGMPGERQRFDVLEILKRYELSETVRSLVQRWADTSKPMPTDVAIQLATSQRAAGEIDEALNTLCASLEGTGLREQQQVILVTQLAAVFLDRYEAHGHNADLQAAQQALDAAASKKLGGEYLARVAARLKALRRREE